MSKEYVYKISQHAGENDFYKLMHPIQPSRERDAGVHVYVCLCVTMKRFNVVERPEENENETKSDKTQLLKDRHQRL